ncbi:putative alanine and proline rich protein [uncultured Mycobacterium sp.]|uniref:Putative alanine and proline rich protein n=1 Tax=uncultured Mycobacterium sp. TaxID=171292 RepID=A0A1Y5P2F1_9MYCO|nr:putative alanine and proline rich protein [uncultured Mycobacterium sp.]
MTADVTARLAAGRGSVSNTQAYVSACHAVGYQHPDLTAHAEQILEWYGGEDGLDLHALDADCALLRAGAAAADEALRVARDGGAAVSAAWQGESYSAASEFIDRNCVAGAAVARALHVAVGACEMLRDSLGRLVDEKVGAAVSIDDRRAGERPAWLTAAAAVTGGGVEHEEAIEIVTQQITPYVDADIRTEWLTAMRSATVSVAAAYEDALRHLNDIPAANFEVPGQFSVPSAPTPDLPLAAAPAAVSALPAATVPAAAMLPPAVEPAPVSSPPMPDAAAVQPLPSTPLSNPSAQPGLAGGAPAGAPAMPDVTGGLSGLVGQIADALGGLFEGIPDSAAADDLPEPDDPVEPEGDEPERDVVAADTEDAVPEDVPITEDSAVDQPLPVDEPVVTDSAPPAPPPEPPPADPLEQPDEQTPCEIAADELAQVGQ